MTIDRKLCDLCGKCAGACPSGALVVVGKAVTPDEILREIEKDVAFYDESDGGVTFSGGEPMMQPDFLNELLEECKKRNIRTALDTCGYASWETVNRMKDKVDLFLYDVKVMDDRRHKKYTGVSNKLILRNFVRLADGGSSISIRFPIVPSVNDDAESVAKMAEFGLSHGVKQMYLLPYHRAGIEKYRSLDRPYKLDNLESPSEKKMQQIKEKLITRGLDVKIGGG